MVFFLWETPPFPLHQMLSDLWITIVWFWKTNLNSERLLIGHQVLFFMYFKERGQRIFTMDCRLSFRGEEAERAVAEAWRRDDPCEEGEGEGGAFVFFMIFVILFGLFRPKFLQKKCCLSTIYTNIVIKHLEYCFKPECTKAYKVCRVYLLKCWILSWLFQFSYIFT